MRSTTEMNMTSGNLFYKIFKFTIPIMMTNVFQLLYTTVDLWTVSKYGGGPLSMTSISSNSSLINLVLNILFSMAVGGNVLMSIAKGKNDSEKGDKILHTTFFIAIFGGIIFGLFGFFVSPYLLRFINTPESIYDNALKYIRVYFLGVPMLMVYNFGSNMLRALGDSKRPLYILLISGITNVLFDLLFVIVFKLDVLGVAIATIISELLSAILVLLWFKYNKLSFVRLSFRKIKMNKKEFIEILKIGIPSGLQGMAFSIPNVFIQSSLYSINDYYIGETLITQNEIISGSGASQTIESYIYTILNSFSISLMSFAGQNFGARNKNNIKKCYWYSLIWQSIFWSITLIISLVFPYQLLSIFIRETSETPINIKAALLAGKERLTLIAFTYILDGLMDLNSNYLKGLKKTVPQMILTILGCSGTRIIFVSTIFNIPEYHTIFWLYFSMPLSWTLVDIVYIPLVLILEKKQFKLIENKEKIVKAPKPKIA